MYQLFAANIYNETYALYELDVPDSLSRAGINPNQTYPSYRFYHDQYSALYAWRSIGYSNYNALEAVYKQRIGDLQADVNYTYSKSMDIVSQAERLNTSAGVNYAQILNSWEPNQLYGVSDFDVTHQINANYLWELPFGQREEAVFGAKPAGRRAYRRMAVHGNYPLDVRVPVPDGQRRLLSNQLGH